MGLLADTVFLNGQVITVNKNNDVAEALALKDGIIVYVGGKEGGQRFAEAAAEVIDLKGRSLVPGFTDAHEHILVRGANELGVDCRSPGVTSIEDIKRLIADRAQVTPKGEWIRGWGYDHSKLAEGRHPDRFDLDEAAPDHKVLISRVCCHIGTFNSNALKFAGVPDNATEIAGSPVGQRNGMNSGVLFEKAYMEVIAKAQPTLDEMVDALALVNDMLLAEGITCCHDAGGHGAPSMRAFQRGVETNRIKVRLVTMLFALMGETAAFSDMYINSGIYTGFGNDRLKLGPVKIMIDGSSSGPTAATLEDYTSMPGNRGLICLTQEYIDDVTMRAHAAGYQMTSHAVGDKGITMIVDAIEKALKAHPREDHRHRIEHCAMASPELIQRIKKLGIVPVLQPIFLYEFGDGYLRNYGPVRGNRMFPCASFIREGVPAVGSSDCPVTFSNPILNMHVAVNRETQTGQVVGPDERISVMDALRMFTWNGAWISFDEHRRGSLEVGKLADLAVLSEPLLNVSKEKIRDVKVDLTFVGGERLYTRP